MGATNCYVRSLMAEWLRSMKLSIPDLIEKRDVGAITYWLDIDNETGLQRVLARDGVQIEKEMRQWQIQQAIHFAKDQTRENCEFKLTS